MQIHRYWCSRFLDIDWKVSEVSLILNLLDVTSIENHSQFHSILILLNNFVAHCDFILYNNNI